MKKQKIIELAVKVIVAALTAFLTGHQHHLVYGLRTVLTKTPDSDSMSQGSLLRIAHEKRPNH